MSPKKRVSYSLSEELIEEIKNRRGLIKKSTFVEFHLRRSMGLDIENLEPDEKTRLSERAH
jgi:hypothetical protein